MWDPLSWSIPLGRLFGINVRVHILFPIVTLGLILYVGSKAAIPGSWLDATMLLALLFLTVLLHEFGHAVACRQTGVCIAAPVAITRSQGLQALGGRTGAQRPCVLGLLAVFRWPGHLRGLLAVRALAGLARKIILDAQ